MSNLLQWTNGATTTLASSIADSDTSATVASGDGALFPDIGANQYGVAAIQDSDGNLEFVWVTGVDGDVLTIARAKEGSTAKAFASGSRLELRLTAGQLQQFLQKNGGDTLSGTTSNTGTIDQSGGGVISGGASNGMIIRGSDAGTANEITVGAGGAAPTIGTSAILTASNLLNNLPSGVGVVVTGMICLWSGASNEIPSGYQLCDGTNNTPDLRDKFVLGAGGTLPTSNAPSVVVTDDVPYLTSSDETPALSGYDTDDYTLQIADIPSHGHYVWQRQASFQGASGAATATRTDSGLSGGAYINTNGQSGANPIVQATGGGGAHAHGLTGLPAHQHTVVLPPYVALFYIMKT